MNDRKHEAEVIAEAVNMLAKGRAALAESAPAPARDSVRVMTREQVDAVIVTMRHKGRNVRAGGREQSDHGAAMFLAGRGEAFEDAARILAEALAESARTAGERSYLIGVAEERARHPPIIPLDVYDLADQMAERAESLWRNELSATPDKQAQNERDMRDTRRIRDAIWMARGCVR